MLCWSDCLPTLGRAGCANGSARLALQIGLGGNLIHPLPRAVDRRVNITQVLQRPLKCFAGLTLSRPWARSKSAKKAFVECITLCLTISKTGKILQLNQYVINWRCRQFRANPSLGAGRRIPCLTGKKQGIFANLGDMAGFSAESIRQIRRLATNSLRFGTGNLIDVSGNFRDGTGNSGPDQGKRPAVTRLFPDFRMRSSPHG